MHLQGRRVVVVKRQLNTELYYLCHSTEQAEIRRLLLLYEYRDEIVSKPLRLKFLQEFASRNYEECKKLFEHSSEVIISVEEFAADEAFVNQGDAMEEVRLDIPNQINELNGVLDETLDAFESEE